MNAKLRYLLMTAPFAPLPPGNASAKQTSAPVLAFFRQMKPLARANDAT